MMDSGSVLSEPIHYLHLRGFPKERSASMTVISPKAGQPKMSQLENLEARMANIEVSLSSSNPGRRRKGTSLGGGSISGGGGGTISARASPRPPSSAAAAAAAAATTTATQQIVESKELRTALQDREAVIQNLRNVLCLGKLPRPTGPPLDESERPAAEQKLHRLKIDAENKRIAIRNLKTALDKLDITDNIDIRIRQAELEYALGREELQLLSLVEEARALQNRLDKSKPESHSLFSILAAGVNLTLHAVQATTGRWAANTKSDSAGLYIEWALDGEGLFRGDRILEVNGKLVTCRTKEELQKLIGTVGKSQLVVLRKKSTAIQHQQLIQQQEDNQRLQHRISYLEEQVRELQTAKERTPSPTPSQISKQLKHLENGNNVNGTSSHITSISISSPPTTPEKSQVYQRGNYVTTLVGGKPIELTGGNNSNLQSIAHVTKTIIKENGNHTDGENNYLLSKSLSASKISINSDLVGNHKREREQRRAERALRNVKLNGSDVTNHQQQNGTFYNGLNQRNNLHVRSVEHLNYNGIERRKDIFRTERKFGNDLRSVKSLDFESDNDVHSQHNGHSHHHHHHHYQNNHHSHNGGGNNYTTKRNIDYTSEPVVPRIRPTPPKKPLRLSLQRAQSLQTVEINQNCDNTADKKRSLKRAHHTEKSHESALIENCTPLLTASLGRHKHL